MPNYPGRRQGTRRVVIWHKNKPLEWVVEGTKADGAAFEARQRVELDAGRKLSTRTAPVFSEFCRDKYRPHAEKHLGANTWHKVRKYQVVTLMSFFGPKRLTELSAEDVEDYKNFRKVKASSVNNELRVLRTILNWAAAMRYPVADLTIKRLPTRGQGRVRVWTAEQIGRLYQAARSEAAEMLPILVYLVNTGCRKGEAIAAEWDWVDLAGGMIRIPANEYWRPKNGMPREVPLADAVRAILSGPRRHERWVFPNRLGGRYQDFPKELYWRIRDAAGLTGGPHTTRHTYASHFLHAVPDLFLLGKVLGHSHQRMTELYSHLLPDHLSRARNAVNLAPTMALTMAEPEPSTKTAKKAVKRH